jgi:virginiamycin B lyase
MRPLNLFNILRLQFLLSSVAAAATASLPAKSVVEYALPAAGQTHEILPVSDHLLLVSQQSDGGLLKIALDDTGRPTGARKWIITDQWSGLHGLTLSSDSTKNSSTSSVWATAQFANTILHIDPNGNDINEAPQIIKTIPIPAPASGPHGILEHNGNLWVACKDSSHVVRINAANPSDHQIWAVSRRPIFVAVHPTSGHVYSGLDLDSKIWHYKNDGGNGEEIAIPAEKGSVPVGTVAGSDGNVWFVLLGTATGGTGTFGRINKDSSIDWFTMTSAIGATAPLIHLAFDEDPTRFWLLGSSITCKTCPDAVYTVKIDDVSTGGTSGPRIATQNTIMMPTQRGWNHRITFHRGSLYMTELITSTLAHMSGAFIDGPKISEPWDQFAASGLGIGVPVITYNNTVY